RGLTGELRTRHQATRDAYEHKFRDLLSAGIMSGEFAAVDVPLITAGILGIGLTVGRWYRPDGRLTPDDIADEYIHFVLKALDPGSPVPAVAEPTKSTRATRAS